MKDIKKYVNKQILNDIDKLNNLNKTNNDKLYFSKEVTNKHINNLIISYNELIDSIKSDNDIINLFTISESNKKLNKTNLKINTISTAPYYLCNNLLDNNCTNCNICYGAKNERFKNILKSRLKNYIYFNILEYLYNNDYLRYKKILYKSIDLNKNKITKIIRINQQSDIKNNTILNILNDMLNYIKVYYNKDCIFYSYSKTKNLNFNMINKDFIINKSIGLKKDIKELKSFKNSSNIFITIDKNITIESLKQSNLNYYICIGSCGSCKNCFKKNNHITLCYKH